MVELAHRWVSCEEIRKMEHCRRQRVIDAMDSGELPYELRGRARYSRMDHVEKWELDRLRATGKRTNSIKIRPDLLQFA